MLKQCRCGKTIPLGDKACEECAAKPKRDHSYDKHRGNSNQRGYTARWQRYRLKYLRLNPLCVECLKSGMITPATVVDHIKPHKGNQLLFWDTKNHQSMCKHHHDMKTASEDMGSW
jgi:5-methylcytosine-specific restriction protein A